MPEQSLCTTAVTGVTDLSSGAIGPASLITSDVFAAQTISVVVGFLPNPAKFGDHFDAYAFLLLDPGTGITLARQLMDYVASGEGTWAGTATIQSSVGIYPKGLVLVFASRSRDGLLGPQAAAGTLADCV